MVTKRPSAEKRSEKPYFSGVFSFFFRMSRVRGGMEGAFFTQSFDHNFAFPGDISFGKRVGLDFEVIQTDDRMALMTEKMNVVRCVVMSVPAIVQGVFDMSIVGYDTVNDARIHEGLDAPVECDPVIEGSHFFSDFVFREGEITILKPLKDGYSGRGFLYPVML